jgi:t-SNARE complex subunit (syntaxin)
MNDRLADLADQGGDATPYWALETGNSDVEAQASGGGEAQNNIIPGKNQTPFDDDEEDFEWAKSNDTSVIGASDDGPSAKEALQKQYMDAFFQDVEGIKSSIEQISNATKRMGEINEKAILATSDAQENELSMQMRPLVSENNKLAKNTKDTLKLLKDENAKFKAEGTVKDSDIRIRENLCNTLTRKFIDEMKLYQNAQQKYKLDLKTKGERQVKSMKPDATPEEIDMVMKSEGGREELYRQTILAGGINESIKQAYANVAGKYKDVLVLEQSVAELHQMFLDFALLTEQQGELIDQIEHNVKEAADVVEDGNVDIHHAIEYQKKIRKKQCWIIAIVIVVTIVLLFSLRILP